MAPSGCRLKAERGVSPRRRGGRGFTLIEVLVALVVVAVALFAVVKATAEQLANASRLREVTFAQWIARNKLTEMQVEGVWTTGRQDSRVEFAGRTWPLQVAIEDTPNERIRRVEVSVADPENPDNNQAVLTGFLAHPELRP